MDKKKLAFGKTNFILLGQIGMIRCLFWGPFILMGLVLLTPQEHNFPQPADFQLRRRN